MPHQPGLGELLRYLSELVDRGSEKVCRDMALTYRPRYTPILRAIADGAVTVTDITASSWLTQGAISQSVTMMEKEGILRRGRLEDGRKSHLQLTPQGEALVARLQPHWENLFSAIAELESEIGYPLLTVLQKTAHALEQTGFDARIGQAQNRRSGEKQHD